MLISARHGIENIRQNIRLMHSRYALDKLLEVMSASYVQAVNNKSDSGAKVNFIMTLYCCLGLMIEEF